MDARGVHVWQYRVNVSEPDGGWEFLETLDHDDTPRLHLEYATPTPPTGDGYWLYSGSYDCEPEYE